MDGASSADAAFLVVRLRVAAFFAGFSSPPLSAAGAC
jgi:hypothetical protein